MGRHGVRGTIKPSGRALSGVAFGVVAAYGLAFAETASVYETDLAAFFAELDATYPFFDLKGIREDWAQAKGELTKKVKVCESGTEFLGIVVEGIRGLHDSHVWLRDAKAEIPPLPKKYYAGVSFMPATQNRVVVMASAEKYAGTLATGVLVTQIDGEDARACLEKRAKEAWATSFASSPQRTRLYEFRIPLSGASGERHTITYRAEGEEREVTVTCDVEARGWPHVYHLPEGLVRVGRSSWHTKLDDGVGYMYLRRVDQSAEPGMRQALETHADAKGWIVDLRGNGGGGYGEGLLAQLARLPRPVAVLIDAGCMSAGETLARDLRRIAGARLFGSRTAGSSSAKRTWAFPSGIASVSLPVRSRWRNDGQPIEYNGIEPDVVVEAVPEEVALGQNSAICRAQEYLHEGPDRRKRRDRQLLASCVQGSLRASPGGAGLRLWCRHAPADSPLIYIAHAVALRSQGFGSRVQGRGSYVGHDSAGRSRRVSLVCQGRQE